MSDADDNLIRWTVRVALSLYVVALAIRLRTPNRAWLDAARWSWSLAYLAMLAHVAAAFHFAHGWSHAAAYAATARQTHDVVGLDWGGGVFVNYLFLLIWGIDVAWWWLWRVSYEQRPRWFETIVQGFFGFIAFNSTVVFGAGAIRWIGLLACMVLAIAMRWTASKKS